MTSHDSCGVSACSSSARPTVRVPRSIASRRGRVDDERRRGGPRAVTRETRVESCGARVRTGGDARLHSFRFISFHVASFVTRSRDGYGRRARLVVVSRSIDGVVLVVSTAGEDADGGERARLERVRGDADGCAFFGRVRRERERRGGAERPRGGENRRRDDRRDDDGEGRRDGSEEGERGRDDGVEGRNVTKRRGDGRARARRGRGARRRRRRRRRDGDDADDADADAFDSSGGRSIVERGTADEGVEADADAVDANRGDAEIAEIVQGWGHRVQSAEFAAETFGERCYGVGREGRRGFRAWDIGRGGAGRRRAARGSRGRDETVAVG